MYYADGKMDPALITDTALCVSMDMMQLLLLMRGVFGQSEFEYYIEDNKMKLFPKDDKKAEYNAMINCSNEELKKAGIIEIGVSPNREFGDKDYQKIDAYSDNVPEIKENLYFLNLITKQFNCSSKLDERGNISYYLLFSNQSGKEFVHYLFAMILQILKEYRKGEIEKAHCVVRALDRDWSFMKQYYNNAETILKAIESRDEEMRVGMYQNHFFINASNIMRSWIVEQQTRKSDIWEFVFPQNRTWRNWALCLMWHVIQINRFLLGKNERLRWEKGLKSASSPTEFYYLDILIGELKKYSGDTSFNSGNWVKQYVVKMNELINEIQDEI